VGALQVGGQRSWCLQGPEHEQPLQHHLRQRGTAQHSRAVWWVGVGTARWARGACGNKRTGSIETGACLLLQLLPRHIGPKQSPFGKQIPVFWVACWQGRAAAMVHACLVDHGGQPSTCSRVVGGACWANAATSPSPGFEAYLHNSQQPLGVGQTGGGLAEWGPACRC